MLPFVLTFPLTPYFYQNHGVQYRAYLFKFLELEAGIKICYIPTSAGSWSVKDTPSMCTHQARRWVENSAKMAEISKSKLYFMCLLCAHTGCALFGLKALDLAYNHILIPASNSKNSKSYSR